MTDEPISFSDKLKQAREKYGLPERSAEPEHPPKQRDEFDKDLVPDALDPDRSDTDRELDQIIENIGIAEAYRRWCNKSEIKPTNKREGIKVSCPIPGHPDKDPSAWINTDKDTWYCGGCEEGGDIYDIAAYHFGYDVPGYKDGQLFHKLRIQMAESFGYHIQKVPGGSVLYREESTEGEDLSDSSPGVSDSSTSEGVDNGGKLEKSGPERPSEVTAAESSDDSVESSPQPTDEDSSNISYMFADEEVDEEELAGLPPIDWKHIVPEDTFLWEYMTATTRDDCPEEYHFWHGLVTLGHAVGRKVTIDDDPDVYANLFLCLLGGTGMGKSKSRRWMEQVVNTVMPYKDNGLEPAGVRFVPQVGSGEALIKAFCYEARDPSNPKTFLGYQPVNGILKFDELAALISRTARQGSSLQTILMELVDTPRQITTSSLTHGGFYAEQPFCSLLSSTQPDALKNLLKKNDTASGFVNRWVFAGGRPKERIVLGGSHSGIRIDLSQATSKLDPIHRSYAGVEKRLMYDNEAAVEFTRFIKSTVQPTIDKDQSDILSRLVLLFKKLCLFFAINDRNKSITVDNVRAAEKLWEYLLACYRLIDKKIGSTLSVEMQEMIISKVAAHVKKTGRSASARDINRYLARQKYPIDKVRKMLDDLVQMDELVMEKPKSQVGRPTIRYKVAE